MNTSLTILISIGLLSLIGMGSILYSLIYEKDVIVTKPIKPAGFYPQKTDPLDAKITSILDDENFSIEKLSIDNDNDNETVIIEM